MQRCLMITIHRLGLLQPPGASLNPTAPRLRRRNRDSKPKRPGCELVRPIGLVLGILALGATSARGADPPPNPEEFFEYRIRPLLVEKCYSCHSETASSGLMVNSRQALIQGGTLGPAIVPGKPAESLLIQAVDHTHSRLRMPLGEKLRRQEIADLVQWVEMGAPWPRAPAVLAPNSTGQEFAITETDREYWAFLPVRRPSLPTVKHARWPQTAIDHFILARVERAGLSPSRQASRRELIRRVSYDLIGLPPTPAEVDAFLQDGSPQAWSRLVDRLLESPHYGERWGRYWLDVARYAEDDLYGPEGNSQYLNAWRYRDWVIQAFNQDMPFDLFVKAQIAGDLLQPEDREKLLPGTGFLSLGVWYYGAVQAPQARADERFDRIDTVSRGFLGLTVGCARCHDHKYDPIAFKDYWALDGIMASTVYREYPLAPAETVAAYRKHQKNGKALEDSIKEYLDKQSVQLSEMLAWKTARYLLATWKSLQDPELSRAQMARAEGIDPELLEAWFSYLTGEERRHPYLGPWDNLRARGGTPEEATKVAEDFQALALAIFAEKKEADEKNHIILESNKPKVDPETAIYLPNGFRADDFCHICELTLEPIAREKYILWLDLFGATDLTNSFMKEDYGLFRLQGEKLESTLEGEWKSYLKTLRSRLEASKSSSPPPYAFIHGMADSPRPGDSRIHLRGNPYDLGDRTPRRFLTVLSSGQPQPIDQGSGRLQLAEAIASHPLSARVMVNRLWQNHFGQGIVRTPGNFGRLGSPPTHPELLEYLTHRFIQGNYSVKALHREILLSATYRQSSRYSKAAAAKDPENRLLWRANRRRLDAEALRDSILSIAGNLGPSIGGASVDLTKDERRRSVYGQVKRSRLDSMLALFDFPDPSLSSQQRAVTNVPSQKLFFLNSRLVWDQAGILADRVHRQGNPVDGQTVNRAYRLIFGRQATQEERELALNFMETVPARDNPASDQLRQYLQTLLSSNEFLFVD